MAYLNLLSTYKYSVFKNYHYIMNNIINMLVVLYSFIIPIFPNASKKLILIIFLFWILNKNFLKIRRLLIESDILKVFILFMIYSSLSLLWSENTSEARSWLSMLFKYWFIPVILFSTAIEKRYIKYIISAFLLSMLINEILSYGIFFQIWDNFLGYPFTGNSYAPVPFHNSHMEYSLYLALTVLIMIYSMINENNKYIKIIYIIFIITMTANLFISNGRTGQFAFVLTSFFLLYYYNIKTVKYLLIIFVSMILSLLLAYSFSNSFKNKINKSITNTQKAITNNNFNTSIGIRLSSYIVVPEIYKDSDINILFGTGLGDVRDLVHRKQIEMFGKNSLFIWQEGHLHNTFLTIVLAFGIIGLILFIYIIYLIFKLKIDDKYISYIRHIFICMIILSSFSENFLRQKEIVLLFSLFISFLIVTSIPNKK